ncbi:MAG: GTP cyclohydrolase I FolE [Bdellovibrionota bacterium]
MNAYFKKAVDANGVSAKDARNAVQTLLRYVGEDVSRNGLHDTPDRFCRALLEMTAGYSMSPEEILTTTFEGNVDEMVLLKDIEFTSICEHHLLSFTGKAHIAYLPSQGRIVGLSKLARLVDVFAQRLQVQERLTQQIAEAIQKNLEPHGVAVVIEGVHSCMCVRGVRKHGATMVTSSMMGDFKTSSATRNEFMQLVRG